MALASRFIKIPSSAKTSTQRSTEHSTQSNIFSYNELSNNEKIKYTWNGVSERPSLIYNLNCSNRNLEKLPDELPDSIKEIDCSFNKIKELPEKLPSDLGYLNCSYNELNELPNNLPNNIYELSIQFNKNLKDIPFESLPNLIYLHLDKRQFLKFFEKIKKDYKKKYYRLELFIYSLQTNKKIDEQNIQKKIKNNFLVKKPTEYLMNMKKMPNNIQRRLKINYNIPNVRIITSEGGSKNSKKINMKKSELQKIALKNKVSLKKRDGTMKKKDELIKSLKLKKLL